MQPGTPGKSKREIIRELVADGGLHTTTELRALGVHGAAISRALADQDIVQYARGIYMNSDPETGFTDNMGLAALSLLTPGVVCLSSAALFHEIGDEDPMEIWYAVDRARRGSSAVRGFGQPHRLVFWNAEMLKPGVDTHTIAGVQVQITNPARTVIDLLRYRGKIGEEIGPRAMRDCLTKGLSTVSDLWGMAHALDCTTSLSPFLRTAEELAESLPREGMAP